MRRGEGEEAECLGLARARRLARRKPHHDRCWLNLTLRPVAGPTGRHEVQASMNNPASAAVEEHRQFQQRLTVGTGQHD
jgi:hypothetical protein